MHWKRFENIYADKDYILKIRAWYLFLFNSISVVLDSIALFLFLYKDVQFLPASFFLFFIASIVSIFLLWKGMFRAALTATLGSGIWNILGGLFFGNPNGNMLLAFPLIVILFLLFTNIRITIYISLFFLGVMFGYFALQNENGTLVVSYAIDSVLIYTLFTIMALLTVRILNTYIDEKNELIKEIHHRVRNNLQVLCGLADLHRNQEENSKSVLFEFQNRILAMSEVHNYMYKSDNYHNVEFSGVIDKIVENSKNKHKDSTALAVNNSDKISLPIETAIPCAMIFNELLENCLTHAFKNTTDPKIEIRFFRSKKIFQLIVKDNGVGMPMPFDVKKSSTTGFTLIHILSKQMHGNFRLSGDQGLTAVLEFSYHSDSADPANS
ncbi:sensor histidine kinase [Leptospira kmetyi]|uniref:sensor histidine kinase n=1 Tax=Leptospira kmetyi TaxID=408139 RepID=UPI001083C902|nr:histidine kinase dimerization/phosphoacceptor domain -containing protein [Leptospira kmetyi]TGK23286.1 sensor histidine kinase [Leptospira kmetyi]TGK28884.1 sensor histidine kinase [Leptospira kmetyi]